MHTATRTRDDSASQMRRNRPSEGGLSLLVIRATRRVARPTPGGAKSAFPRRGTLTGAVCCLYHRRRQPGRVRLPRKLFLNPAPLGCHHHLHLSRSRHWLSLLVCVPVQVIYGVSAVSGHFGDVVLWGLNPPAAGEVRVSAGGHPRLLCGSCSSHRAIMHTTRVTTFARAYHNNRPDPDAGADGCVEGGESRPCAGGVVLWERALLAWGIKISLGEPAGTRAKDEKGEPDASTDADALPARCSGPPAAAAGRNGRPELTKSPPNSRAVRAQSAESSGVF